MCIRDRYEHLLEELLESTQVFRGKLLDVRRDRVRLPDGNECLREYVRHQGAAVIIASLDDGRILFVRQHRYPLHRTFLELPAGKIDPGEEALDTASRESVSYTHLDVYKRQPSSSSSVRSPRCSWVSWASSRMTSSAWWPIQRSRSSAT